MLGWLLSDALAHLESQGISPEIHISDSLFPKKEPGSLRVIAYRETTAPPTLIVSFFSDGVNA